MLEKKVFESSRDIIFDFGEYSWTDTGVFVSCGYTLRETRYSRIHIKSEVTLGV
jgi:hypothetical protein